MKFEPDLAGTRHGQEAQGLLTEEGDVQIRRVVQYNETVLACKGNDLLEELHSGQRGGWVVRVVQEHQPRAAKHVGGYGVQVGKEPVLRQQRHGNRLGTGENRGRLVDRVTGIGIEHHIARIDERQGKMGDPLLRTDERAHLACRIQRDPVETQVVVGHLAPEIGQTSPEGILVVRRVVGGLCQGVDDALRGWLVGVADAKVDDVHPLLDRLALHAVEFDEGIRGQFGQSVGQSVTHGASLGSLLFEMV